MLVLAACASFSVAAAEPAWVATSNQYAMEVLQKIAEASPESGSELGIETYDSNASDLTLAAETKNLNSLHDEIGKLQLIATQTNDARVTQDLQIMIDALQRQLDSAKLSEQYELPFYNVAEKVFGGIQVLLDDRNSDARMQKAIARLNAYVGTDTQPGIVAQAQQRTAQALANKQLTAPYYKEVEQAIANTPQFIQGIEQLFTAHKLQGWQPAPKLLKKAVETEFIPNVK
jgi:hypothetical protein